MQNKTHDFDDVLTELTGVSLTISALGHLFDKDEVELSNQEMAGTLWSTKAYLDRIIADLDKLYSASIKAV